MKVQLFDKYTIDLNQDETGTYQLSTKLTINKNDIWTHIANEFHLPLAYFELLSDNITLEQLTFVSTTTPQKIELELLCDSILISIFQFSAIRLTLSNPDTSGEDTIFKIIEA